MATVADEIHRSDAGPGPLAGAAVPAVVAELRKLAVDHLGSLLDQMLDRADDLLFEMSERAGSNAEVRVYFDTMRAIRLDRARLAAAFRGEIGNAFSATGSELPLAAEITIDELTLQDSRSIEQSIAVGNMETKAEALYKQELWELHGRLLTLSTRLKAPISVDALSPSTICRAFQKAADMIKTELQIELIIYKLFDRNVISQLGPLYAQVLALLDQRGVEAQRTRFRPLTPRAASPNRQVLDGVPGTDDAPLSESPAFFDSPVRRPWNGPAAIGSGAAAADGGALPPLDPQTFGMLQHVAGRAAVAPLHYSDANLAADLANAAQGRPVFGWSAPQAFAYAQRTGLIGRMFNELLNDPHLPDGIKPELDQLRFGVIKSALKDPAFFADQTHPVRLLVDELATIAATTKTTDGDTAVVSRVRGLLSEAQRQIDEPPGTVRTAAEGAVTVDDELAEQFIEHQRRQSRNRRKAIIAKVREVVDAELRLHTAGLPVPESIKPLLQSGWSTMMAYHLIRENRRGWNEGSNLLQRLTQALDPEQLEGRTSARRELLREDFGKALFGVGLLPDRVEPMLAGLASTLATLDADPAEDSDNADAAPAPTAETVFAEKMVALLELLLVAGRWFHVYDRERKERRWLKLARASGEGSVFTEFNGKNPLTLSPQETFDDLMSHRIEPIDAPPAARQMLDALIARRERG